MTEKWVVEFDGGHTARSHETPVEALEEAKAIYERDMERHAEYCRLVRRKKELEWEISILNAKIEDHQKAGADLMPVIEVYDVEENGDRHILWANGQISK